MDLRITFALVAAATASLTAQEASPAKRAVSPLRILFVGETGREERTKAFEDFLAARFASVKSATHESFNRGMADAADVVLLDWHQNLDAGFPPKTSPLGARESWDKPTVLLGSAGLLTACVWQVQGGSG